MLHCVASLHIGWYSPIKSEYASLRRCSSGVSNDCFCTFLSLVDWIRLRNLTDCIAVHINKWGSLLDQCGNGHCQTSHFINPGISKCWNWSEMECDACAWSPGRPQSLSVATLIPSKPKCWGEPADFLKAWQEYIKQWWDSTVNKYARTERWVSVCVVYCAADWNTMLYIQQVYTTKCFFSESLQAGQLATFKKATLRRREKTEVVQERNLSTDVKGQQHVHARLHASSPS